MRVALLICLSMFFTKADAVDSGTSITKANKKKTTQQVEDKSSTALVVECLELLSFHHKGKDGKLRGQCQPSKHLGAFYTKNVDEATSKQAKWECFDKWPDGKQTKDQMEKGFAGICKFSDFVSKRKKEDIPLCPHKPLQCSPGPQQYWGACVSEDIQDWMCIDQGSKVTILNEQEAEQEIADYVNGDCQAESTANGQGQELYKAVCRFATKKEAEYPKAVKCPRGVSKKDAEFNDGTTVTNACFSIEAGKTDAEGNARLQFLYYHREGIQGSNPLECEWIFTGPEKESFYDGECIFETHKDYEKAPDWSTVKPKPGPQPALTDRPVPAPTPPVKPTPSEAKAAAEAAAEEPAAVQAAEKAAAETAQREKAEAAAAVATVEADKAAAAEQAARKAAAEEEDEAKEQAAEAAVKAAAKLAKATEQAANKAAAKTAAERVAVAAAKIKAAEAAGAQPAPAIVPAPTPTEPMKPTLIETDKGGTNRKPGQQPAPAPPPTPPVHPAPKTDTSGDGAAVDAETGAQPAPAMVPAPTPTEPVKPTLIETDKGGVGAGWIMLFVFLIPCAGFLLWQRSKRTEEPRQLSGGIARAPIFDSAEEP